MCMGEGASCARRQESVITKRSLSPSLSLSHCLFLCVSFSLSPSTSLSLSLSIDRSTGARGSKAKGSILAPHPQTAILTPTPQTAMEDASCASTQDRVITNRSHRSSIRGLVSLLTGIGLVARCW